MTTHITKEGLLQAISEYDRETGAVVTIICGDQEKIGMLEAAVRRTSRKFDPAKAAARNVAAEFWILARAAELSAQDRKRIVFSDVEPNPATDAELAEEGLPNRYGCKPDEDVCVMHDEPLICKHGCSRAKDHECKELAEQQAADAERWERSQP